MPSVKNCRIGLLGGSFNPAHEGHLHISRLALEELRLDQVWWLVAPQNPLKSADDMAPFATRLALAEKATAEDTRIVVTGIEQELGTRYTLDTVRALKKKYPEARFVLVMGADLLAELPKWKGWRSLFRTVPIAVFARPTYSLRALSGTAARRFARFRIKWYRAGSLAAKRPPVWAFLHTRPNAQSATKIRARRQGQG